MGGVTVPLAFPYPTGTDRVMDGDNAIQALAEKVDDYLTTTGGGATNWIPATPYGAGFTGSSWYRRDVAGNVHFVGNATFGTDYGTFFTFPVGFRPVRTAIDVVIVGSSLAGTFARMLVNDTSGAAQLAKWSGAPTAVNFNVIWNIHATTSATLLPAPDTPEATPKADPEDAGR